MKNTPFAMMYKYTAKVMEISLCSGAKSITRASGVSASPRKICVEL